MWTDPDRNYDVVVAYYGSLDDVNNDPRIAGDGNASRPDFVYRAHGAKHQNLYRLHALYPGLLATYDAVAVWDDDLEISARNVRHHTPSVLLHACPPPLVLRGDVVSVLLRAPYQPP